MKLLEKMILKILVPLMVGTLTGPIAAVLISNGRELWRKRRRMRRLIRSLAVNHTQWQFPGPDSTQGECRMAISPNGKVLYLPQLEGPAIVFLGVLLFAVEQGGADELFGARLRHEAT
jgi:hypothetical protein